MQKKIIVMVSMTVMIIISIAAIRPKYNGANNFLKRILKFCLKISVRRNYQKSWSMNLKMSWGCLVIFAMQEDKNSHKPDYASDEKPEKQIARYMMRMTIGINEKYFDLKHP